LITGKSVDSAQSHVSISWRIRGYAKAKDDNLVLIGSRSSSNKVPLMHGTQLVTCLKCNARFEFRRSVAPHIDECGFEVTIWNVWSVLVNFTG
jgi:hypothetical protein